VSEEVNRKCPIKNMTVQLSTPYIDIQCHNAIINRQTDDTINIEHWIAE